MKIIAASLGAFVLNLALMALLLVLTGTALWLLVPVALPVTITWTNGLGLAGLLYLAKAVFK